MPRKRKFYDAELLSAMTNKFSLDELEKRVNSAEKYFLKTGKRVEKLRDYRRALRLKRFSMGLL